jgi:anti-anti-sigma factor
MACLERAIMGLQISTRESDDVTILDLTGRVMAGPVSDPLSPHLQKLVAKGASKLLLNLIAVTQLDSWSINAIAKTYASLSRQGGSLKILCPSSRSGLC